MTARPSDIKRFGREFALRLDEWDHDGPDLTEEETQRYLAGEDPDLLQVTRYLGHQLTAEEAADMEQRFIHDEAFYNQYWPVVTANQLIAERHLVTRAERELAARAVRGAARGRRYMPYIIVAVILMVTTMIWQNVQAIRRERAENAQGRVTTSGYWFPSRTETGAQPAVLKLGQVLITLGPQSRLTRGLSVFPHNGSGFMGLDGSADFVLRGAMVTVDTRLMRATIRLDGEYVITSIPGASQARIDVLRGDATVEVVGGLHLIRGPKRVDLQAGQRAIVERNGSVVVTTIPGNPTRRTGGVP